MRKPQWLKSGVAVGVFTTIVVCFIFAWVTLLAQDFSVTSVRVTNNNVRIAWDAPGGSNYVVQSATNLVGANFTDVSPVIFIPGSSVQPTNYTHTNGLLNSTSRFYRVRSSSVPPTLQIHPNNAIIGRGMTNRYRVLLVYADNTTNDVTATATLTSLNTTVAQVVGLSTNGTDLVRLVRGSSVANGIASIRAVYTNTINLTNTASLTVTQFSGGIVVEPPPPVGGYKGLVEGQSIKVEVIGLLGTNRVNITPSSSLVSVAGTTTTNTRVKYEISADVANSLALITGQSAAAEDLVFIAGTNLTSSFPVNWCWFTSITLVPQNARINVGETLPYTVSGRMANGTVVDAFSPPLNGVMLKTFDSSHFSIAEANAETLSVTGLFPGSNVTIRVNIDSGPGDFCRDAQTAFARLTVVCPGYDQVDQTFNSGSSSGGSVDVIALQSDSKILLNYGFNSRIGRLNTNGGIDASFNPGSGPDNSVKSISVQPDGKILIGGSFNAYNGTNRSRIARLNNNGSLDVSFNPGAGANGDVQTMVMQPDGKILIGGYFSTYNNTNRSRIARLNIDGTLDTSFNPGTGISGFNSFGLNTIVLRADGKVLIGGFFSSVNGTNRNSVARLNSDGSLDTTFNPGSGPNESINAIAEQADGMVIFGGGFSTYNSIVRNGVARLNNAGALDTGFNPNLSPGNQFGDRRVYAAVVQPDGQIILGGFFNNNLSGSLTHKGIVRLGPNGSVDPGFLSCGVYTSSGYGARAITQEKCLGQIYIGGDFYEVNGITINRIARLLTGSRNSPSNDNFSGRIILAGSTITTNASNDCASKEAGEPSHAAGNAGGKSLWWSWTAPVNGLVTVNTCGSSFDTLLGIYIGNSVSALTLVTNNNDNAVCGAGSLQSQVQFNAVAGTTYQIAVDGFKYPDEPLARSGNISLNISLPSVVAQWNFNSPVSDAAVNTGTLNPSVGSGTVSYVGGVSAAAAGEFATGSFADQNTNDNSGWNTSNYPFQGTGNKTAGAQFNVSTVGKQKVLITWDQRVSGTGSKYFRMQYSTNGVNFVDFPTATTLTSATVFESKTNDLAGIFGINNNPNFAFRIVSEFENTAINTTNNNYVGASSGYIGSGTVRFDMVTIFALPLTP